MRILPLGVVVLFAVCWAIPPAALADHLPENKLARGRADTVLSGVDIYKTPMTKAIVKLGKPAKVTDVPSTPDEGGGRSYEWQRGDTRLELFTWNDKGDESVPYSAEVWGKKPAGNIGTTGRGLHLGDRLADVRRIYGGRFIKTKHKDGSFHLTIQWEDETTLDLDFDKTGYINHMHLMAEVE